jgi:drug/metabolite transporter (DMT)-like permease
VVTSTVLWSAGAVLISYLFRHGVRPLELVQVRIYVTAIGLGVVALWRRRGRGGRAGGRLEADRWPGAGHRHDDDVAGPGDQPAAGRGGDRAAESRACLRCRVGAGGAIRANTLAFALLAVVWLLFQAPQGVPRLLARPGDLLLAMAAGVFSTLIPFVLFGWGTARLGSQAGAINISLEPVFSAIIAWIWLGQSLDVMQIGGMLAVIGGIVYTQRHTAEAVASPAPPAGEAPALAGLRLPEQAAE